MLTLNPSELILTIINFFLLFFLLRKFLYTPIIKFVDERKKGIEEKMEMEAQALSALEEKDRSVDELRRQALAQAEELLAAAKSDGEHQAKLMLQQARDESAFNRKKAAIDAAMVGEMESQKLDKNIDRLAHVLAESLLA